VWQGVIHDPTLSMQIRNGFKVRGILYDHISDPRSNNAATLIVRDNPHYRPPARPQPPDPPKLTRPARRASPAPQRSSRGSQPPAQLGL
jgi:hypothetical protein